MDSSTSVIGIGFDRATGLFTALEEQWENLKSTNKLAYKFKTKLLEHEDLMWEVFTGVTAIRKHRWTLGEQVADIADGESDSVDSPGLQPFTEPYQPVVDSPPAFPIVQVDEAEQGSKRKRGVVQVESRRSRPVAHQCLQTVSTISPRRFVHRSTLWSGMELVHLRSMALRHACKGLWLYPTSSVRSFSTLPALHWRMQITVRY